MERHRGRAFWRQPAPSGARASRRDGTKPRSAAADTKRSRTAEPLPSHGSARCMHAVTDRSRHTTHTRRLVPRAAFRCRSSRSPPARHRSPGQSRLSAMPLTEPEMPTVDAGRRRACRAHRRHTGPAHDAVDGKPRSVGHSQFGAPRAGQERRLAGSGTSPRAIGASRRRRHMSVEPRYTGPTGQQGDARDRGDTNTLDR